MKNECCMTHEVQGVTGATPTHKIYAQTLLSILDHCSAFIVQNGKIDEKTRRLLDQIAEDYQKVITEVEKA